MLTILVVIALLIAGLLFWVSRKPDDFRITRSRHFPGAAPDAVHHLLNDFHLWQKWSPWEGMDPALNRTYSGAESGVGAIYAWKGNRKVGEGRMEITESRPGELVRLKLDFIAPMKAKNMTDFTLAREGDGTRVTWDMYGPANFMSKLFSSVMNLDKLVGKDFDKGLDALGRVLKE